MQAGAGEAAALPGNKARPEWGRSGRVGAGARRGQGGRKGAGATGGQGARTSEAASPVRRGRAHAGERRVGAMYGRGRDKAAVSATSASARGRGWRQGRRVGPRRVRRVQYGGRGSTGRCSRSMQGRGGVARWRPARRRMGTSDGGEAVRRGGPAKALRDDFGRWSRGRGGDDGVAPGGSRGARRPVGEEG